MSEPRLTGTKHCNKCDRDLPVICFSINKRNVDGLDHLCRDCKRKKSNRQRAKSFIPHNYNIQ